MSSKRRVVNFCLQHAGWARTAWAWRDYAENHAVGELGRRSDVGANLMTKVPCRAIIISFGAQAACQPGSVAEWLKAPVLKTGDGQPFVSSNLTASARFYCFCFGGLIIIAVFGPIAQLGERRVRNAEVVSSILIRSTIYPSGDVRQRPEHQEKSRVLAFFMSAVVRQSP